MTAHTPGPWRIIDGDVYGADAQAAPFTDTKGVRHEDFHDGIVAIVYRNGESEAGGANARLIAAAPELYAIAERITIDGAAITPELVSAARAAIAKVERRES